MHAEKEYEKNGIMTRDENKSSNAEKEYEKNLIQTQNKKKALTAKDNILNFYKSNKEICDRAYECCKDYLDHKGKYVKDANEVDGDDFCQHLLENKILVITVTETEEAVFLCWLKKQKEYELESKKKNDPTANIDIKQDSVLESYIVDSNHYIICDISGKTIIQIRPLDTGDEYTRVAINAATKIFEPSYVIMLGICYGLDMKNYEIGSIFLSNRLITFRINFRDNEYTDETEFEAQDEYDKEPENELIKKIQSKFRYTQVACFMSDESSPKTAKTAIGKILSSNSLMSSKKVKEQVIKHYASTRPKALGGEMEGAGILKSYIVQEKGLKKWMIIKSICDWGEKKNALSKDTDTNERIKTTIQAFAMANSCSAFQKVLDSLK